MADTNNSVLNGLDLKKPETAETPGQPVDISKFVQWIMFYRHGNNPHCQKTFLWHDDMRLARQRALTHCSIMGYNLTYVRPGISDLDLEEYKYQHGGAEPENGGR